MNALKVAVPCVRLSNVVAKRWMSQQGGQIHPAYFKVKEKYKKFQVDDGVPVHLKGGALDKFLYYTTFVGCAVGFVMMGSTFYSEAFPKKD